MDVHFICYLYHQEFFCCFFFDEPKAEFQKCYLSVLPLSYYRKFIIFYAKDDK